MRKGRASGFSGVPMISTRAKAATANRIGVFIAISDGPSDRLLRRWC
jgi:hypothetical protein